MTRFRADESHPLCDPDKIEMKFKSTSKDYFLDIFFPEDILHGYNPTEFNRIGFTYTLHGTSRRPQNFALSSEYVSIAQNPSLWASCQLI
jgi:hypothetical protein